jgi:hypothetical protein
MHVPLFGVSVLRFPALLTKKSGHSLPHNVPLLPSLRNSSKSVKYPNNNRMYLVRFLLMRNTQTLHTTIINFVTQEFYITALRGINNVKQKQSYYRPGGFQEVEAPRFYDNRHMKWQGCQPYAPAAFTPGNINGTHFCWRRSRPQGRSTAERIMPKSSDAIWNRSRDLPV